jgi:hypothetical protein
MPLSTRKKRATRYLMTDMKEKIAASRNHIPARKVLLSNIQVLKKKKHK